MSDHENGIWSQDGEMKHERTGETTAPAFPYVNDQETDTDVRGGNLLATWRRSLKDGSDLEIIGELSKEEAFLDLEISGRIHAQARVLRTHREPVGEGHSTSRERS